MEGQHCCAATDDRHQRYIPYFIGNSSLTAAGYDVSNVANIQARLYEAFGNIELLPWIGLSYSLASFAVLGLSRKILYCFNMRWIYIVNVIIFMAGAAVSGAATNISAVIVGRIIMGVSGAIVYQRYSLLSPS